MSANKLKRKLLAHWGGIGRHWNSVAFRLTLNYGLLSLFTTLILLLFIYTQVLSVLRAQLSNQISHAQQRLGAILQTGNIDSVVEAINRAIADELDGGEDLYLLLNQEGHTLAGNIDIRAIKATNAGILESHAGLFKTQVQVGNREVSGHFKRQTIADDHILLIGYESGKIDRVNKMILRGIGLAFVVATLLVVLGSLVFRREFERRVRPLRSTAKKVGAGRLSLRVPHANGSDEFAHLNHDVNEMLDRIEQLMNGVRDVSDTIAHDLRTPLMRILSRLRSVQRADASRMDLALAVENTAQEIEQLNILLGKLLQISELEAGVRRTSFTACRLDLIVADVVDLYSALAEEKSVTLTLSIDKKAELHGDAHLLANACANLLDNAVKYASAGVGLEIFTDDTGLSLIVQDDGPGIPRGSLERLGERFYRPDASDEGLGLGLASVKAIVALHGGKIEFARGSQPSEWPGLEVRVWFPRSPVSVAAASLDP